MTEERGGESRSPDAARGVLIGVFVALAAAAILYRILVSENLEQTSLLFIGIPAVLGIITALTPQPRSATGLIVKVTTLALLMAGVLLGEGFVCILMASPLFYLVGVVIGVIVDRGRREGRPGAPVYAFVLLVFVPASMEGVGPGLSFGREEAVSASSVVAAAPVAVESALSSRPDYGEPLPRFLRLGFPRPVNAAGAGLEPGARRVVVFEHRGGARRALVLEVTRVEPGRVSFGVVRDHTIVSRWLELRKAEVRWRPEGEGTRVSWTLQYRRRLDPAWYFGPLERYGIGQAAAYLIEAVATPR